MSVTPTSPKKTHVEYNKPLHKAPPAAGAFHSLHQRLNPVRPSFSRRLEDEYRSSGSGPNQQRSVTLSDILDSTREHADVNIDSFAIKTGWEFEPAAAPATSRGERGFDSQGWRESSADSDECMLGTLGTAASDTWNNFGSWLQDDFNTKRDRESLPNFEGFVSFPPLLPLSAENADDDDWRPLSPVHYNTDMWWDDYKPLARLDETELTASLARPPSRREGNLGAAADNKLAAKGRSTKDDGFLRKMSEEYRMYRQMKRRPSRTSTGSTDTETSGRQEISSKI